MDAIRPVLFLLALIRQAISIIIHLNIQWTREIVSIVVCATGRNIQVPIQGNKMQRLRNKEEQFSVLVSCILLQHLLLITPSGRNIQVPIQKDQNAEGQQQREAVQNIHHFVEFIVYLPWNEKSSRTHILQGLMQCASDIIYGVGMNPALHLFKH